MMPPDPSQPPGPAELASWVQQDAVFLRDACARIMNRWDYIRSLGEEHTGGELFRLANLLATVPQVYYGEIDQEKYNFNEALAPARRGQ